MNRIDPWWLVSLLLWLVPFVALLPLGFVWLHQHDAALYWFATIILCGLLGFGVQFWLRRRERAALDLEHTGPDPAWPPSADGAWTQVEELAETLDPADWPLDEEMRLGVLALRTLERVAGHFHPEVETPLLELRVPHALLIIERASRDLRRSITEHVPLSHRLTIGTLARAYRWRGFAERVLSLYRAGHLVLNPVGALLNEALGQLRQRGFAAAREDLYRWLLQEYVRQVGRYAIELYSGRLPLNDAEPVERLTRDSRRDLERAVEIERAPREHLEQEPMRFLVLGRSNAGKSSLINALFGHPRAAVDILPDTTRALTPYRLEHDGLDQALILDSLGAERLSYQTLHDAANVADAILWVSAAHRPDRQSERRTLQALRTALAARIDRRPPPVLVVVTHIDQLRPLREWRPPYDLTDTTCLKAMSIQAAVAALATDLDVPIAHVIPVCLAEGRFYNVEDTLWAALLEQMDRAQRARLLRCQVAQRRQENWTLLRRQLANAGRFLLAWPGRSSRHSAPP
ncbi:GTPase family protein [Allochromatium vinosum]|uniref:GTP-binding protein HSR1-related protein n=1 Tax=Allochromatium vinosum (strain ATCC 17899 / DSM 180 / NBRC 103801 / NCIMB 10441 / D) TaxID=572477 RepID=D3RU15_ALLVD|nr:GTPase domain-containing protein [Allochromatium vinosum]ADC62674.1 GTP-binding protein HSR1-related protein [Allochromatium vinosum DSM 180]